MNEQTLFALYGMEGMVKAGYQVILFYILWNILYQSAREKITAIAGVILLGVNLFEEWFGFFDWLPMSVMHRRFLVSAIFMMGYSFIRYKKHCPKAVLALTLFYGFHSFSFLIFRGLHQYMENYVKERWWSMEEVRYEVDEIYWQAFYMTIADDVVYIIAFLFMLYFLGKIIAPVKEVGWYDVCFLSVLNVVGGLLRQFFLHINLITYERRSFDLMSIKPEMKWMLPLMAVLLYLGEISAIAAYRKNRRLQSERERIFMERQQVKAMKMRLEEAETFYGSIRKLRHDMKSHMTNIKGLVAGEQYGEVENYIEKLDESIGELEYKYVTGNAITDVIINDKYKKTQKAGIRFDVNFCYQEMEGIEAFDIGIILNNLLDNAVTACEKLCDGTGNFTDSLKKPYVCLDLIYKNNFLLLEVENSFDGVILKAADGLPQTTKDVNLPEVLMEHGIGLRNVKDIAERYLGTMDISAPGDTFKVMVMMQKPHEL